MRLYSRFGKANHAVAWRTAIARVAAGGLVDGRSQSSSSDGAN